VPWRGFQDDEHQNKTKGFTDEGRKLIFENEFKKMASICCPALRTFVVHGADGNKVFPEDASGQRRESCAPWRKYKLAGMGAHPIGTGEQNVRCIATAEGMLRGLNARRTAEAA